MTFDQYELNYIDQRLEDSTIIPSRFVIFLSNQLLAIMSIFIYVLFFNEGGKM